MLRLRLASLAVACGLFSTLSGCATMSEDGRMFPRLFHSTSMSSEMHGECECQHGAMPHMMGAVQGPILTTPSMPGTTMPIPSITNIPANQPPQVFKVPTAPATPYVPVN